MHPGCDAEALTGFGADIDQAQRVAGSLDRLPGGYRTLRWHQSQRKLVCEQHPASLHVLDGKPDHLTVWPRWDSGAELPEQRACGASNHGDRHRCLWPAFKLQAGATSCRRPQLSLQPGRDSGGADDDHFLGRRTAPPRFAHAQECAHREWSAELHVRELVDDGAAAACEMDVEVGAVEQADRSAAGGKLACGRAEVQGDGASVAQAEGGARLAQPVCQGSWIWHETEASG